MTKALEIELNNHNIIVTTLESLRHSKSPNLVLYLSDLPNFLSPSAKKALFETLKACSTPTLVWFLQAVVAGQDELIIGPVVLFKNEACIDCVDLFAQNYWLGRESAPPELSEAALQSMVQVLVQQVVRLKEGRVPTLTYPNNMLVFHPSTANWQLTKCSSLAWCLTCPAAEVYPWETYSYGAVQNWTRKQNDLKAE